MDTKAPRNNYSSIVAILPRGEAIRNFIYTGTLKNVANYSNLTVLSVSPNKEIVKSMREEIVNLHSLTNISERWIVGFLREIIDMAHGRWLWSKAAQERWYLRDFEAKTVSQRFKRLVKKLICLCFANSLALETLSGIEGTLSHIFRTTDEYIDLFLKIKPSLVFNCSHVHSHIAIPVIHAAKRLKIPTATFIFSWDNLTSQGRIIPNYDYYLVWNQAIRDQLLKIYSAVKPNQVFVTGTPQFDFHFRSEYHWTRERFCKEVGADPQRPIVLYSTGMANHMPGEPLIVKGIAKILRRMNNLGSPQLIVRVYPKDQSGRFERLREEFPEVIIPRIPWEPSWLTPKIEDSYLLVNMLKHAAVGINIASTISLELLMFDKPVINIAYNPSGMDISPIDFRRYYEFDHYKPIVKSAAVTVMYSEDELQTALEEAICFPEKLRPHRSSLLNSFFSNSLDGLSGERIANCLLRLSKIHSDPFKS